jgi:hypothetical protein
MRTGKRAEVNTQSWGDRGLHWLRWPAPPTPPWMARIQETLSQRCELQAVGPRQGRNLSRGHALHPPPAARRRARQVGPLWGPRGASGGPQGGGGPTSLKMITTLRCSLGACVPVCGGGVGVLCMANHHFFRRGSPWGVKQAGAAGGSTTERSHLSITTFTSYARTTGHALASLAWERSR